MEANIQEIVEFVRILKVMSWVFVVYYCIASLIGFSLWWWSRR